MHKRMTITLDEAVYEGLNRTTGKRRMSQFIEDLLRPYVAHMCWIHRLMTATRPWLPTRRVRLKHKTGATH